LESGFQVTLEIGEETTHSLIEVTGTLPPALELASCLQTWQQTYRQSANTTRISLQEISIQTGTLAQKHTCQQLAKRLYGQLHVWLESPGFHPVDKRLRESLNRSESIRVLLRTKDQRLHHLPWHLWDFIERYPFAEMAISTAPQQVNHDHAEAKTGIKILAILGDRRGIDTESDRQLLAQLPDAEVLFLVEPTRQQITHHLWEQPWDILFFAGHSQTEAEQGRIHLNAQESLTLEELKYGLRKAISRGLKLAMFNSCDGLGLAYELEQLHIPQLIIMRQPVPDQVAQEFLKHFLLAFAQGNTLYLSVREARERLQAQEDQFPCATWLPIIFQNPAVVPPSWEELGGGERQKAEGGRQKADFDVSGSVESHRQDAQPNIGRRQKAEDRSQEVEEGRQKTEDRRLELEEGNQKSVGSEDLFSPHPLTPSLPHALSPSRPLPLFLWGLGVAIAMTGLVSGIRYLGLLQPLEIAAFDQLLRMRPAEPPDPRLLVITITDEDVQMQPAGKRQGSLSDQALAQLLQKLDSYQPRAIGLDIYRDFPVAEDEPKLAAYLKQSDRLVPVCKVSDPEGKTTGVGSGVAPPPEARPTHVGFSDFALDSDNLIRRHLLALTPPPSSPCQAAYAFSVHLALRYLQAKGLSLNVTQDGLWQIGKLRFQRLVTPTGGYQRADDWGHQILLNYRSPRSPEQVADRITLKQALSGQLTPESVKDRIILIGTLAEGSHDFWQTPYKTTQGDTQFVPGVILQAQMTSQLLSAALDGRLLLWTLPVWGDILWISGWTMIGSVLSLFMGNPTRLGFALVATIASLFASCLILLIQLGVWLPLIPAAIAIVSSSVGIRICVKTITGRN
jgi:CHASE2 domain-containing sensor protein